LGSLAGEGLTSPDFALTRARLPISLGRNRLSIRQDGFLFAEY
jgi:hypothetical protein